MTDAEFVAARMRSAGGRGVVLSAEQARTVAAILDRIGAELASIRDRTSAEVARRAGRWSGPESTLVCQALRWAVFGAAWPVSEGGPDPDGTPAGGQPTAREAATVSAAHPANQGP
jgi:hypothetical protein